MRPAALVALEEQTEELIHLDAVRSLVPNIYVLDVTRSTDTDFAALQAVVDKAISILSALPIAQNRPFIEQLLEARAGVEQGMAPDRAKRPTLEEMRQFVAEHLD